MIERKSYIGKTSDGVSAIWTDQHPEDATIEKTITFFNPDEGKVFVDKEGNMLDSVVITDGVDIAQFVEIQDPRNQEEPKEETNDSEENQND